MQQAGQLGVSGYSLCSLTRLLSTKGAPLMFLNPTPPEFCLTAHRSTGPEMTEQHR